MGVDQKKTDIEGLSVKDSKESGGGIEEYKEARLQLPLVKPIKKGHPILIKCGESESTKKCLLLCSLRNGDN